MGAHPRRVSAGFQIKSKNTLDEANAMQVAYADTKNKNVCLRWWNPPRFHLQCSSIKLADLISSFRILISQLLREYYIRLSPTAY